MSDLFQKACPDCGRPLRLKRISPDAQWGANQRFFECSYYDCHYHSAFLDAHRALTIDEMALDMAQGLFKDSTELGKRQSAIRRLAGGIRKLEEGRQYLSVEEAEALTQATQVLERLATAAELSKKKKKALEQAETRRVESRRKEASAAIRAHYHSDDLVVLANNTLTLSIIQRESSPPLVLADIEFHVARPQQLNSRLHTVIQQCWQDQCRKLTEDIAYRHQPVTDLLTVAEQAFEQNCEKSQSQHQHTLDALREALSIEQSDNVVRLDAAR